MAKEYGYDLSLVDLGGGWSGVLPTENEDKLVEASKIVKDSLVYWLFSEKALTNNEK